MQHQIIPGRLARVVRAKGASSRSSVLQSRTGGVTILEPADVLETLESARDASAVILDPWYNRGVGGVRHNYDEWLGTVVDRSFDVADHVYVWGFPQIVCRVLDKLPPKTELTAWITWYYKNCPSMIRGWRSAQYTCLHLSRDGARLYPENFMTEEQQERYREGKMRYIPGPPSVLEVPLNIGFVGRGEQTGHPAQKPLKTIEPLVKMSSKEGDLVIDPMCGSGTTGVVCNMLNRKAVLCDMSEEYTALARKRVLENAGQ
ncbi:DNA modification methylase [Cenarchaeum symbiosum A]|uniref:Type II methyltransferase n=1 Tax=Cenarchaeum symbiosum (strain A) TaxID=414004 RepID=A0RX38_CENSY|nr:DNA modification methylase [Cenarchaeum symbiosum A]